MCQCWPAFLMTCHPASGDGVRSVGKEGAGSHCMKFIDVDYDPPVKTKRSVKQAEKIIDGIQEGGRSWRS